MALCRIASPPVLGRLPRGLRILWPSRVDAIGPRVRDASRSRVGCFLDLVGQAAAAAAERDAVGDDGMSDSPVPEKKPGEKKMELVVKCASFPIRAPKA